MPRKCKHLVFTFCKTFILHCWKLCYGSPFHNVRNIYLVSQNDHFEVEIMRYNTIMINHNYEKVRNMNQNWDKTVLAKSYNYDKKFTSQHYEFVIIYTYNFAFSSHNWLMIFSFDLSNHDFILFHIQVVEMGFNIQLICCQDNVIYRLLTQILVLLNFVLNIFYFIP